MRSGGFQLRGRGVGRFRQALGGGEWGRVGFSGWCHPLHGWRAGTTLSAHVDFAGAVRDTSSGSPP